MANEKELIDYDNLAFNPYAISTGDLTIENDNIKSDKGSMDNHGYSNQSEAVVENNPHYEDTLEVVKKAGLTGTGPRKKENIIYEETIINKKNKDKTKIPKLRAGNLPPRPTEEWQRPDKNNQWKMPFAILCVLVLLGLVGGALGVLAYFKRKDCSCDMSENAQMALGSRSSQQTDTLEKLKDTVDKLSQKLQEVEDKLDNVEKKQQEQEVEQKAKLKFTEHLSTRIDIINSTSITKFNSVKSNVSNLAKTIDEFKFTLWNTTIFSRQLSNTVNLINSSLTIKLTNISKQIGPRGYNGSQGIEGPPGIGNISACKVDHKTEKEPVDKTNPNLVKIQVTVREQLGYKIIAADCSTNQNAGAGQTALSLRDPDTYVCTCAGESTYGPFRPINDEIQCVLTFWQCPTLT